MIDYPSALAVATVARTGSFEKAARELHVTPSAISQRVKQLEERLGVVLIERGSPCSATDKGQWLCRHIEHVGMLEHELIGQLPGLADPDVSGQRVTLNIATNADSLGTWLLPAFASFSADAGHLLNIAVDDEEHTADWLLRGRVLAAVTSISKPIQGCRVVPLGSLRYRASASPVFWSRHFEQGVTLESLARAPAITFSQKDRLQVNWMRTVFGQDIPHPTHWLPSTQGFVAASLAGMGWCLNPEPLVREHLEAERLVELVADRPLDVQLYWQVNRLAADALSGLTRVVVETARRELLPVRD